MRPCRRGAQPPPFAGTPAGAVAVLTSPSAIVLGWVGLPSVLAGLYWLRRHQSAELGRLRELEAHLRGE